MSKTRRPNDSPFRQWFTRNCTIQSAVSRKQRAPNRPQNALSYLEITRFPRRDRPVSQRVKPKSFHNPPNELIPSNIELSPK
jgi:hypothetical protein